MAVTRTLADEGAHAMAGARTTSSVHNPPESHLFALTWPTRAIRIAPSEIENEVGPEPHAGHQPRRFTYV